MAMIERCAFCQTDFTPRSSRVRCCSRLCGNRLYYIENKDRIISAAKQYAKDNPEAIRRKKRSQYLKHREKLVQVQRDYRKRKAAERAALQRS